MEYSKLKRCDNCLAVCTDLDDDCHYCGTPLSYDGTILPDRPRTVGQEMTFATVLNDLRNEPEPKSHILNPKNNNGRITTITQRQ